MRKVLITIFLIIEIFMVNLTYQSFLHKEITKEENKVDRKQFAMYIKEKDEYVEYKEDNLFPKGYYVNKSLSKCVDENDNPIEIEISSLGGSVTITSNKTVYCTLYFDKNEMLEYLRSKDTNGVLSEDIVGDMYRYQGVSEEYATDDLKVVDNNYICLGEDCSEYSEDLYRIIGVTETGELKVIKKTVLSKSWFWTNNTYTDVKWPDSYIYHGLNDDSDSFYNSLDSKLQEKITNHKWMYGDAIGHEYDGDLFYKIESGNTPTRYYIKTEDGYELSNYTWNKNTDYVMAKVGLQYTHDYLYAYPGGKPGTGKNASQSWIFFLNNDDSPTSITERLMTRFGCGGPNGTNSPYLGKDIYGRSDLIGELSGNFCNQNMSLRPVFYLTSDLSLIGEGTLDEPFEIDYEKTGVDIINSKPTNLSDEEVGGMHRYQGTYEDVNNNYICFGTNDRDKCLNNPDTYMYRIIGILSNGEMKLIKQEYLDKQYPWYSDYTVKVEWPDSEVYRAINNEGFLNNETYLPKIGDINWQNKILSKNWYYGYIEESINLTGEEIYEVETGNKETSWNEREDGVTTPSEGITCSVDTSTGVSSGQTRCYRTVTDYWTNKVPAKIGLAYLHDIKLSVGDNQTCTSVSDCENGWILKYDYPSDLSVGSHNYLITALGYHAYWDSYINLTISPRIPSGNGVVSYNTMNVRPTLYIDGNTTYKGKGTLNYPYVIIN